MCSIYTRYMKSLRFFFLDFICNCEGDFHLYSLTAVHSYDLLLHKYWDLLVIKTLYQIRTCCIVNQSDPKCFTTERNIPFVLIFSAVDP